MKRFGEIPISPDDKQGKPGKKRQDSDILAGEPSVTLSPEPELTGERPVLEHEIEPAPKLASELAPESFIPPPPRRVPAKKKKRDGGRLFLRSALWVLVPVCIVLLGVAGSYFFVPFYIKGPLARSLGEQLDRPVEISRAVFSPFSLRLFIEDITIGPMAGKQNEQVLLECPRIDCRLGLDRISSGQLVCENIKVKDLVMRINRDVAVSSDFAAAWRLIVPAANMTQTSLWPEWLLPGEITLTGGTLLVDDPAARKQYRMEQVELYLPPLDSQPNSEDRLPRLSAVINASPVQVEAVQVTDSNGRMETRFDLKIKSLVLANYVQTLPVLDQQLKLVEGEADLDLSLIFPQTGSGGQRILLEGSSALTAVKVADQEGTPLLSVPSAQLNFQIAPLAQRYRFSRITLDNPQFNLLAKSLADKDHGLTMAEMGSVLLTPVRLPLNLGIDQLQLNDGAVHIALPGPAQKELSLNKVSFSLEHFASQGVSLEEKKGGPARFILKAVDNSTDKGAKLTGEGEILPDGGVTGQVFLEQFNLLHYQDLLPQTEMRFVQGSGNLHFAFASFKPEAGPKEKKEKSLVFRVTGGELGVTEYALEVRGKKAAAGGTLRCSEVQAEPAAHRLTCSTLEFTDSEIFTPGVLATVLGRPAKGESWQLDAQNLRAKGVKLHVPLLQTLCSAKNDLVLKNFQAEAKDLTKENVRDNISAQGSVGAKGSVKVSGGYSLAQAGGDLQIDLQHLDFALFDPCLGRVVIPKVKQGTINIQGNVALPAREFSGQMWVNDVVAGEEDGPSVSWQLATSDRVTLRTEPLHLDLGEVMVRKPVVQPGLLDTENLLHNFLKPGQPAFQNLAISKVSLEDGRFIPFWPVLLPGYQPRLEGVSGSITALGQKTMPFFFSGKVGDLGSFTVTGKAGMDRVENYSLEIPSVSLVSFADFFLTNMGMSVESAQGKWQQTMSRADNVVNVATAIRFQGLQPVAESPLLLVSALLLGKNGELQLESRDDVADGSEPPFLLTSVQRHLQRQGVRADISKELVLREYFPQLQLPVRISFAPGLAEPLGAEGLSGYRELFGIRPYLGLRLHAVIDNETDREALRQMLQQEADLKREAENSRRALIKLQREEEEKKRLAEIKAGKTPVVSEEIAPEELTGDLEPLPYVPVEVTEAMLAELAILRLHAVQAYLQQQLSVEPARVQVGEGFSDGAPQVELQLVPVMAGNKPE